MSDLTSSDDRLITPEAGQEYFVMQAQLLPEIESAVLYFSGGSVSVVRAIIERMGEAISKDPMQETTVSRIREVIGAPDDSASTDEVRVWRGNFWDAFKAEKAARLEDEDCT